MFENLVESTSHKDDLSRKGGFFLGTLAIYAVLAIVIAIVLTITYNDHLDALNMELTTMVAPVPIQAQPEQQQQKQEAKPQQAQEQQVATRTEFVASNLDPTKVPQKVEAVASKIPPVPPGGAVLSNRNSDPVGGGSPVGVGTGTGGGPVGGTAPPRVVVPADDEPPPPPKATPEPKKNVTISGGVLNGKAISRPTPPYPPIARAARASGVVQVQVTVDETGKVISAHAISGNPLLQQAAVQTAYSWRFSPTLLSGQPVKVTGSITFNFNLQ
ncbi:MAG: periplasmic protein TonB [Acidobacteriota bacterium]|jgi:protein TonB|nr:periplasmic protein TonB [Acidobacteriota bacterium]